MSRFTDVVDAIVADLTTAVPELGSAKLHRYAPWTPQELEPDGSRHLAVWPMTNAQRADPVIMGPPTHYLTQLYRILVWENSPTDRGVEDEAAVAALYDLHDAIEARFELVQNEAIAGAFRVRYQGTALPERSSSVRYFEMQIEATFAVADT